uniref:Uncharacterized protein n=1 Tax=Parascaris univalens TaxID=6257 RepID=A0A914ZFM2_PARUN
LKHFATKELPCERSYNDRIGEFVATCETLSPLLPALHSRQLSFAQHTVSIFMFIDDGRWIRLTHFYRSHIDARRQSPTGNRKHKLISLGYKTRFAVS